MFNDMFICWYLYSLFCISKCIRKSHKGSLWYKKTANGTEQCPATCYLKKHYLYSKPPKILILHFTAYPSTSYTLFHMPINCTHFEQNLLTDTNVYLPQIAKTPVDVVSTCIRHFRIGSMCNVWQKLLGRFQIYVPQPIVRELGQFYAWFFRFEYTVSPRVWCRAVDNSCTLGQKSMVCVATFGK